MPKRVRMSPVDTAWLRMDSPGNLMMIVGVDLFDGACDLPRLRRLIESQLLQYRQFRSRVVQDPGGAWWEEDEDFDIDQHLVRIGLPGKGGKAELQKLVAQLAGQALDPTKPLWQFHLVENYDGGHAVIVRIHHCIADGIALIGVLMGMTTADPAAEDTTPPQARRREAGSGNVIEQWLRPFTEATVRALDATGEFASRVLHASGKMIEDPELATDAATAYARVAAQFTKDVATLALMESDTPTRLKGRPGGSKVVAWNEPLPLADVKAVGRALGCSINDVLLSCVAGAIRAYLIDRGDDLAAAELRAMVPVNLRPPGSHRALGNRFGLAPVLLPIGIDSPVERVLEVRRRMSEMKDGYLPVLAMAVLGLAGIVPRVVQAQLLDVFQRKATAVMTNVPGPQQTLYMAGSRLRQMMFWVPQSGDIGIGVSILSYDGGVQFGLVTDKKLCDDPQGIIDRFAPEFEKLVYAVLLMPWEKGVDRETVRRSLDATEALAGAAQHLSERKDVSQVSTETPAGAPSQEKPARARRRRSAFAAARVSGTP
ncbi:MAG: WS/DGAT/MGAT family O-acyltransferase [Gemmatimonadota bacterium]